MLRFMLMGAALVMVAGCASHREVIDAIVWRQKASIENLPAEERSRLMLPEQPEALTPAQALLKDPVLTLERARRIALLTNPDIHASRARIEAALARIDEARSYFAPQLGMVHTSTRTFQTPSQRTRLTTPISPVPQIPDLGTTPSLIDVFNILASSILGRQDISTGNSNSFSDHATTLSATWTIFDGLVRDARLRAAKHNFLASAMSLADAQRLLLRAVDTAYYQVQLGREQLRVAQAAEAFSQKQLDDAQRRFEARKITKDEVLNFEVRVRSAQANVVAAQGVRDSGRVALAELLALPQSNLPAEIELASLGEETAEELTPPDVEEWVGRALGARPDLAQADHIRAANEDNIDVAKGQFSPELNVTGTWGYERLSNVAYSDDDQASGVALELRWQLYSGGFRTSQVRRARADWWESVAEVERKRLEVAAEVRSAVIDLINSQEQVRLQRLNLISAEENRRIVETEFAAGKTSVVRLNQAQQDYVEIDAELARARIQLRQAWSDLRAAAAGYQVEMGEE